LSATDFTTLPMKVVCAWCQKIMSESPSPGEAVTHGICAACLRDVIGGSIGLGDFVDRLSFPVLVTDGGMTVVEANRAAATVLGRAKAALVSQSPGVAIECFGAHAPDCCGQSSVCQGCRLRQSIQDTHADGRPRSGVYGGDGPALGPLRFRFSVQKVGDVVMCLIEDLVDSRASP